MSRYYNDPYYFNNYFLPPPQLQLPAPEPAPAPAPAPEPAPAPQPAPEQPPEPAPAPEQPAEPAPEPPVKKITIALNIITGVLSVPALVSAIWIFSMKTYKCEDILNVWPLQGAIIALLAVAFAASNVVIFLRKRWPVLLYLMLLFLMCLLAVMFVLGLALIGNSMANQRIPASPARLAAKVYDSNNWGNIKSCLLNANICDRVAPKKLSSVESGCCIHPAICGVNMDVHQKKKIIADDADECNCNKLQIDTSDQWYDCLSCKQGFLKQLNSKWGSIGKFLISISALLFVFHLLSFVDSMWENLMKGSF